MKKIDGFFFFFVAGRKGKCLPVRTLALRIIIFLLSPAAVVKRLSSRSTEKNTWSEYDISYSFYINTLMNLKTILHARANCMWPTTQY